MVANITSGSNFFGVANYNQQKVEQGRGEVLYSQGLINTHPTTIDYTLKNLNNSRTKKPVFHVSLSFSEQDKTLLNDKKLMELTQSYLKKMGYNKQPYVVYRHDDTKHPHVHVVTTRVDISTGKRLPAYKEGIRSKDITDQLEKQHGLTIADNRSNQIKTDIQSQVSKVLFRYKPESIKGLNKALTTMQSNIRAKGLKNGTVYYKVDQEGKRLAGTYKSSQFKGSDIVHKELHNQFLANAKQRQNLKQFIQDSFLQKGKTPSRLWVAKLKSQGVKPIFHEGKKGIHGVSFQYQDHIYKGSTIDRKLSFGNIKERLIFSNNPKNNLQENLADILNRGEAITKSNPHTGDYITSNALLNKQLNSLSYYDRIEAVNNHNTHVERSVDFNLYQFTKAMEGYNEDLAKRSPKWERGKVNEQSRGLER